MKLSHFNEFAAVSRQARDLCRLTRILQFGRFTVRERPVGSGWAIRNPLNLLGFILSQTLSELASLVILSQFVAGCVWIESGIWQDRKINGSLQGDG